LQPGQLTYAVGRSCLDNSKDRVEDYVCTAVRTRRVTLAAVQLAMATDWTTAVTVLGLPSIPKGLPGMSAVAEAPPAAIRAQRQRESLLAWLDEATQPLSTVQLEAAHGLYLHGRTIGHPDYGMPTQGYCGEQAH
jgi:hypothetical protein